MDLDLVLSADTINQGEIVPGRIVLNHTEGHSALSGLNGLNIQKTIYLISVSPFIGKDGNYEADAKVIFLKTPETPILTDMINGEEINIRWKPVEIIPTEDPKSFLLGDFDVPFKRNLIQWGVGASVFLMLIAGTWFLNQRRRVHKKIKIEREKLKKDLIGNETYAEIVNMWAHKKLFLDAFPEISEHFKEFEKVLFKYQFKESQAKSEVEEISHAYKDFCSKISGILNGI